MAEVNWGRVEQLVKEDEPRMRRATRAQRLQRKLEARRRRMQSGAEPDEQKPQEKPLYVLTTETPMSWRHATELRMALKEQFDIDIAVLGNLEDAQIHKVDR